MADQLRPQNCNKAGQTKATRVMQETVNLMASTARKKTVKQRKARLKGKDKKWHKKWHPSRGWNLPRDRRETSGSNSNENLGKGRCEEESAMLLYACEGSTENVAGYSKCSSPFSMPGILDPAGSKTYRASAFRRLSGTEM